MDYKYTDTGQRMPRPVHPTEVPAADVDAYAYTAEHARNWVINNRGPQVDGKVYHEDYYKAWTNAPQLFQGLWSLAISVQQEKAEAGQYTLADHEMIDLVLTLDEPRYYIFLAGHTATAICAGIRIEAIEALSNGQENLLTEDERLQVDFIRAVRDMKMTDALWHRMVHRLGSVRGAIYFAFFVGYLRLHQMMMQSFGAPAMKKDEWDAYLAGMKDGSIDPALRAHDYLWNYLPRPASVRARDGQDV
ncbi:MAG: hypothetical protein ABTQ31_04800 [Rhizobiaceae bacterium]